MSAKVLLVTTVRWPSVARYAAGFAAAGMTVEALAPKTAPVILSRYVARSHRYRPLALLPSLKRAIEVSGADLLSACDERAVSLLLDLHAQGDADVQGMIARSLGNPSGYAALLSRVRSLGAMHDCGVRVARTHALNGEDELDHALGHTGLPAVLKIDGSWGGDGIRIARDRDEAVQAFRRLAHVSRTRSLARALKRRDAHFVSEAFAPVPRTVSLQRFVEGVPAACAFAAWEGKLAGVFAYDVLAAEGDTGPPNVIRRVRCPDMCEAARIAARRFGLSGLFGMDFIRDVEGNPHLIEINPRGTQGGTLPFASGCDLPSALVKAAFGGVPARRPSIAKDIVVTFPRLWLSDPQSPWLKIGHHDVPWDDPRVLDATLAAARPRMREARRVAL
jgi:hypothetical protein